MAKRIWIITGPRRSGKSMLAADLAVELLGPTIVFDDHFYGFGQHDSKIGQHRFVAVPGTSIEAAMNAYSGPPLVNVIIVRQRDQAPVDTAIAAKRIFGCQQVVFLEPTADIENDLLPADFRARLTVIPGAGPIDGGGHG